MQRRSGLPHNAVNFSCDGRLLARHQQQQQQPGAAWADQLGDDAWGLLPRCFTGGQQQQGAALRPIHTSGDQLQRWASGHTPVATPAAHQRPTPTSILGGSGTGRLQTVKQIAAAWDDSPEQPWADTIASYRPPVQQQQRQQLEHDATSVQAVSTAKQLNRILVRCQGADELLGAVQEHWMHLDVINLATSLRRLAAIGEEQGDAATFAQRCLTANATFQWILANLASAATAPEFGSQSVANCLTALAKLQCGSPELAAALQGPLLRCLQATCAATNRQSVGGSGATKAAAHKGKAADARKNLQGGHGLVFTAVGLSASLHALAKDFASCKSVFLAVRHWLLRAVWQAMHLLDAQAVVMVFWALAEVTSGTTPEEFSLETECPELLSYLAGAGRSHAHGLSLHATATIASSCGRMRPQLRDSALLQTLCNAALSRVVEGREYPSPQPSTIATLFTGLASLRFTPERSWVPAHRAPGSLLDELSACMLDSLRQAKPAELAGWAQGAAELGYVPSPQALQVLLAWLAREEGGAGVLPQLMLQRFSSHELCNVVLAVCTFLQPIHTTSASSNGARLHLPQAHQSSPVALPAIPLPLLAEFHDALDSVLGMRLGLSAGVDPRALPHALQLTPSHVGTMLAALSKLPPPGPPALSATLDALAAHCTLHSSGYDAGSLPGVLAFLASSCAAAEAEAPELPADLAAGLAERGAQLLQEGSLTLRALAVLVHAAGCLLLDDLTLLAAIAPAITAQLSRPTFVAAPPCSPNDVALLVSGVAKLTKAGLLQEDQESPRDLTSLWALLMRAADSIVRSTPHHVSVFSPDQLGLLAEAEALVHNRGWHLPASVRCLLPPAMHQERRTVK